MGASPSQLLPGSRPGPGARNRTPWGRCLGQAAHTGPRFRAWHKQLSLDAIRTSPRGRHSLHHPAYRRNYSAASTEKKKKTPFHPRYPCRRSISKPRPNPSLRSAAAGGSPSNFFKKKLSILQIYTHIHIKLGLFLVLNIAQRSTAIQMEQLAHTQPHTPPARQPSSPPRLSISLNFLPAPARRSCRTAAARSFPNPPNP